MSKDRFHFLVAVHAFFVTNDKVLLSLRANTGYMDGFFSVPAGHVDGGEKITDAMKREVLEEVGIQLNGELEPVHVMHRLISNIEERIDFFFLIDEWIGEPSNLEIEKCAGISWHDQRQLPTNTIPYVKYAFENILDGKRFSEFD